jgi:hypothetical protein
MVMPTYEYRLADSVGLVQMTSKHYLVDDAAAKATAQTIFDTFLDFQSLEIWCHDRRVTILRRENFNRTALVGKGDAREYGIAFKRH